MIIKTVLVSFYALLATNAAFAAVEDEVVSAYTNLAPYIYESLLHPDLVPGGLSDADAEMLQSILNGIGQDPETVITFKTDPRIFEGSTAVCDKRKLAFVHRFNQDRKIDPENGQFARGTPVYWNVYRFYERDPLGNLLLNNGEKIRSVTFYKIVQLWIHELGHQAGYENHEALDVLGGKIASVASNLIRTSEEFNPKRFLEGEELQETCGLLGIQQLSPYSSKPETLGAVFKPYSKNEVFLVEADPFRSAMVEKQLKQWVKQSFPKDVCFEFRRNKKTKDGFRILEALNFRQVFSGPFSLDAGTIKATIGELRTDPQSGKFHFRGLSKTINGGDIDATISFVDSHIKATLEQRIRWHGKIETLFISSPESFRFSESPPKTIRVLSWYSFLKEK